MGWNGDSAVGPVQSVRLPVSASGHRSLTHRVVLPQSLFVLFHPFFLFPNLLFFSFFPFFFVSFLFYYDFFELIRLRIVLLQFFLLENVRFFFICLLFIVVLINIY